MSDGLAPGADAASPSLPARAVDIPEGCDGMRLDRFLAARFPDRTRSWFARGLRAGQVTDASGRVLRAASMVRAGQTLHIGLPGIAASTPPPPFPPVLYEDERLAVVDKPAGLLTHPTGTNHAWALVSLARTRWPTREVHLAHRLDRDTSGVQLLAFDADANRHLKTAIQQGAHKEYEALARGIISWDHQRIDAPIGPADGPIRIQMACRPDGLSACTEVTVLARGASSTHIRCVLHTGRTHQIRVHLASVGHALVGDRMYGVSPEVFLRAWEQGVDAAVIAAAGAPRQALHARRLRISHPDGGHLEVEAPLPDALRRWFETPAVLPFDDGLWDGVVETE
jgi:23S rRNA pseudouridine1911/1915/1917 synthase